MNRDLIISKTAARFFVLRKLDHYARRATEAVLKRAPEGLLGAWAVKAYIRVHEEMHEAEEQMLGSINALMFLREHAIQLDSEDAVRYQLSTILSEARQSVAPDVEERDN